MLSQEQLQEVRAEMECRDNRKLVHWFAVLGDPCRFRIFQLLMRHREVCVTDVAGVLGVSLPAASQHLKVMELAGLVRKERMGQMTCYMLEQKDALVRTFMRVIAQQCKGRVATTT